MHQTEDGSGRPDAQGEGENGHGAEAGVLRQQAQTVPKVLRHRGGIRADHSLRRLTSSQLTFAKNASMYLPAAAP